MQAPASLDTLSQRAGVDFSALHDKYKHVAKTEQEKAQAQANDSNSNTSESEQAAAMKAMQRLDDYKICSHCHGQGIVKELYNHFWQERDCPECDGEAIIQRQLKQLQKSLEEVTDN